MGEIGQINAKGEEEEGVLMELEKGGIQQSKKRNKNPVEGRFTARNPKCIATCLTQI